MWGFSKFKWPGVEEGLQVPEQFTARNSSQNLEKAEE